MKIVETVDIPHSNHFLSSNSLMRAWKDIEAAVQATDWPHGSGSFTIYPESGKKSGEGNGVKAIKTPCIDALRSRGWMVEAALPNLGSSVLKPGDLDALKNSPEGYIAFEWETGNISSSHRAINKLLLAMQQTNVMGSFLVVPSDELKKFLTDRIGNIGELRPYFPLWQNALHQRGALRIIAVEHDATSFDVAKIPKGTDGRANR